MGEVRLWQRGMYLTAKKFLQRSCTAYSREEKFYETEVLPHTSAKRGRVYGNVEISATANYYVL